MNIESPWRPRLVSDTGSPCDRLVGALADDIMSGRLESGARLPAHRELASQLHIGLGTVTKAYAVLQRRGLVRSVTGSGTFVAVVQSRRGPSIDLSRNAPPAAMTERLLSRMLAALAKRVDADPFNSYPPAAGHDEHRRQMARWFQRLGMDADPRLLLLTSGAQHALAIALAVTCGRTGTLFVEAHTYPGTIALARHMGCRLVGLEMDDQGLAPESLDRAAAAVKHAPAAVYITPTMQNPTTSTMSRRRRADIVAVCRARNITIIEDDVYAQNASPQRPPLAMLAPERTLYANSLSKTFNPALRIGGLVVPASLIERAEAVLEATALTISPLTCAVMEQALLDGTAEAVSRAIQEESRRRYALAKSFLGDAMRQVDQVGYHVWLPMHRDEADRVDRAATALGVIVTPPRSTAAAPAGLDGGVRLCIGAPSIAELTTALGTIAALVARQPSAAPAACVR
jgi:DNA-binding transcriptional MocR family regulator